MFLLIQFPIRPSAITIAVGLVFVFLYFPNATSFIMKLHFLYGLSIIYYVIEFFY